MSKKRVLSMTMLCVLGLAGLYISGCHAEAHVGEPPKAPEPAPPPAPPPPPAPTPPPPPAKPVLKAMGKAKIVNNKIEVPGKVHFDNDKATIKDNAETKDVLDSIAKTMQENKTITLLVIGSTDSKGTRDHNLKLSADRANAVVDKLVSMGVDKSRLQAKGWGPDKPVAANDTEEHREANRRTDFFVLSTDGGATQTDEGKAALNDPAGGATAPAATPPGGTTSSTAPAGTATPAAAAPKK